MVSNYHIYEDAKFLYIFMAKVIKRISLAFLSVLSFIGNHKWMFIGCVLMSSTFFFCQKKIGLANYKASTSFYSPLINRQILEKSINHLNSVCSAGDNTWLSKQLKINSQEASSILRFELKVPTDTFSIKKDYQKHVQIISSIPDAKTREDAILLLSGTPEQQVYSLELTANSNEIFQKINQSLPAFLDSILQINIQKEQYKRIAQLQQQQYDSLKTMLSYLKTKYDDVKIIQKTTDESSKIIMPFDLASVYDKQYKLAEQIILKQKESLIFENADIVFINNFHTPQCPENMGLINFMYYIMGGLALGALLSILFKKNNNSFS